MVLVCTGEISSEITADIGDMRIKNWTKLNAKGLWEAWRALFDSEDEAVATTVWCANRLVKKSSSRHTRRVFYEIKDSFMRRYGRESVGQMVRRERAECWGCDGEGCERCDWSGIYRERILYVHRFEVAGQPYSFHSYQEPGHLVAGLGEDAESYGGQFTEAELDALALPMSGLVRMLRYVAAVVWRGEQGREVASERQMDIRYFWAGGPS